MHYLKFVDMVGFIFIKIRLGVIDISGFSPIADQYARILILGSMPGEVSLQQQKYYGHERNAFWPIMLSLFNEDLELKEADYDKRKLLLIENQIAVWDVLQSCCRKGSLDSAIKMDSLKTNDFDYFFTTHAAIKKVCFNGAKAEYIYIKHVLPDITQRFGYIEYVRLPSTSPAHAAMTVQKKTAVWKKEIKDNHT